MGVALTTREAVEKEVRDTFGLVPEWFKSIPDAGVSAFWNLHRDFYLAETKIPLKYKELIGIAVSGATRCKYCALFHTEGAKLQGATDEEINEACLMAGVTMMASTYLNARQTDYEQFERETKQIVGFVRDQQSKQGRRDRPPTRAHA